MRLLRQARVLLAETTDRARISPDGGRRREDGEEGGNPREDGEWRPSKHAHGAKTLAIAGTLCFKEELLHHARGCLSNCL